MISAWWRILEKIYSNKSKLQTRTDFAVLRIRELFQFFYGLASQSREQRKWIVKTETAVPQPTKAVTP